MGEAKRRKQILGDRYGSPDTSKRELHRVDLKKLKPDYGTHYVATMGVKPCTIWIANPLIAIGESEANIGWTTGDYLRTLIVTPEFARNNKKNPSQPLQVVPDPGDAYITPLGERVIPFKLVESSEK